MGVIGNERTADHGSPIGMQEHRRTKVLSSLSGHCQAVGDSAPLECLEKHQGAHTRRVDQIWVGSSGPSFWYVMAQAEERPKEMAKLRNNPY